MGWMRIQYPSAYKHSPEKMMAETDTQHLEKLRTYWKRHHAFPSITKLCEVVGMASTASVFDMVSRLKDASSVKRVEGRIAPTPRFFARPLAGQVRAGLPQPREEENEFGSSTSTTTWCLIPKGCPAFLLNWSPQRRVADCSAARLTLRSSPPPCSDGASTRQFAKAVFLGPHESNRRRKHRSR